MHALAALLLALPIAAQDAPLFQARFVDPQGQPLAGVQVSQRGGASALSDGQGRVVLPMSVPQLERIVVSSPGRQRMVWDVGSQARDVGQVVLAREAVLVGRIVDADGRALGGKWRVAISTRSETDGRGRVDFTRDVALDPESGEFRIEGLPAGDVDLIARHVRPAEYTARMPFLLEAGVETYVEVPFVGHDPSRFVQVELDLPPGVDRAPIELRLVDADGLEWVQLSPGDRRFQMTFIGLGRPPFRVRVNDSRFESFEHGGIELGESLRGRLIGRSVLRFQADGASAGFLKGATCAVLGVSGRSSTPVAFPPDGRLKLAPGDYSIQLDLADGRRLIVPPVTLRAGVEFTLPLRLPRAVMTTLRVVDDRGQPVSDAEVILRSMQLSAGEIGQACPPFFALRRADGAGRIEVKSLSDGARVTVSLAVGPFTLGTRTFTALAGEAEVVLPPHGTLVLSSRFPAGQALPQHDYGLSLQHTGADGVVQTSSNLRLGDCPLTVTVPPGRVALMVHDFTTHSGAAAGALEVGAGERVLHEIDLAAPFQAWREVVILVDGMPRASAAVRLFTTDDGPRTLYFKDEGDALLLLVDPGQQSILVVGADGTWLQEHSFESRPLDQRDIEVEVARIPRRLRFLGPDGGPIALTRVDFTRSILDLELNGKLRTLQGGYAPARFSPGPVTFTRPGCAPIELEWSVDLPDELVLTFEED